MDTEEIIRESLETMLKHIGCHFGKITIEEDEQKNYKINIESDNPNLLIGYHGESIQALQHVLKVIAWKKTNREFTILLDVDNYRTRQEDNVLKMVERKIDTVRQTGKSQPLPPMSAYLRRKVHLLCMEVGHEDIETISEGEGDKRRIIIKLK